jgi:NAD(P)H-dependent FMN reductase
VLVDAKALELPVLDRMWKEIKENPPPEYAALHAKLAPLAELYSRSDGYCIVSGEYNHSIEPGLSNLIDYFLEDYNFRPSAIVSYSPASFGGVRAAMQLRAMLAEVGMASIPSTQPVPLAEQVLSPDGVALTERLTKGSAKFFDEFEWYMRALQAERAKGVPY